MASTGARRPSSRRARASRGPTDPDRREKIVRAAIEVVGELGVEGMTHRAVARAAGVPLGSTTYHFTDREEMLEAAVRTASSDTAEELREWSDAIVRTAEVVPALVRLLTREASDRRDHAVVTYELYLAAVKRPSLRPVATEWSQLLHGQIARHTDLQTAAALAAASEGILMVALATGKHLDGDEVGALLERVAR